jgi:hypothetical protein
MVEYRGRRPPPAFGSENPADEPDFLLGSALLTMLPEGIIEDDDYAVLRRGLAARTAIAHGFLNQVVDAAVFEEIRDTAKGLLATRKKAMKSTPSPSGSPKTPRRSKSSTP